MPLTLYAVLTFWYTNTAGPLSAAEIQTYSTKLQAAGYATDRIERLKDFMATDTGRQFLMVNNLDMAVDPADVEGALPGESAAQLMDRYMAHMYPALLLRACHPVYVGEAIFRAIDVVGIDGAEIWDRAVLLRYRSRRDLMDIVSNPAFTGKHEFKSAALDKTIAYPLENTLYLSDPRLLLALLLLAFTALTDSLIYSRGSRSSPFR
ncbi:hypothetical protein N9K35_05115 [Pseudomonadales bacterium]|nr:hypothetical protein [Pseudomonadales bacterium]